ALARRRVPRPAGVALHYLALAGLVAFGLWLVVPQTVDQLEAAVHTARTGAHGNGDLGHPILSGLAGELRHVPPLGHVVRPALALTTKAITIVAGVVFVLASAAYWIFERDRTQRLVLALVREGKRVVVRDTWDLVDRKLGSYLRGVLAMVCFVSTVLSLAFWQIGLPYWLLLGMMAGIVELIPVVGPLVAGAGAVAAGLTVSWRTAALAAVAVYGLRLVQDYVLGPRVLGHAVELAPLVVLFGVTAVGLVFGAAYVPLATPFTAVVVTVLEVLLRERRGRPAKVVPQRR